ncbi:hypothetical protein JCM3765_006765 [Sporobolomyces pararoseus]
MSPSPHGLTPRQDAKPTHPERPLPTPYPPSDLENLAPIPEIRDTRAGLRSSSDDSTNSTNSIAHLPPLPPTFHTEGHAYRGRTSEPSALQSSIGYSMSKLLNLDSFTAFLSSQNGYQDFWEYLLAYSSPHLHTLEFQRDLQALIRLTSHSSAAARAMREVYCTPSGEKKVLLKADLAGDGEHDFMSDMGDALLEIAEPPTGLERASRHLLQELYSSEFESFVKHRLLAHTKLQLEKRDLNKNDIAGLGEAFVLSNPKLHDCPIVLASPAFSALTGYTQDEIVGRNCRFLQGESTSPESVNEIRQAIKEQRAITQLLLNYDKSGAPFFNLLCIVPLFSPSGELIYFIGGQTDVTGALGNGSRLALPGRNPYPLATVSTNSSEIDLSAFSPVVQTTSAYSSNSASNLPDNAAAAQPPRSDSPIRSSSESSNSSNHTEVSSVAPSVRSLSAGNHYGSELVDPSTRSSKPTGGKEDKKPSLLPIRPKPFSRSSTSNANRNSFLGPKSWTTSRSASQHHSTERPSGFNSTAVQGGNGSPPAPKLEYKQGTVERRIHDFQTTYEKVILVSRADRKILFNTGAFLRYCGLPASSREQVDNSELISTDLLDVIKGPAPSSGGANGTVESSSEVRAKIAKAFEKGEPCSVRCGIKVEEKKVLFKTKSAVGTPTAYGVLHMTPMKDINERTTAYVAIFA